MKQLRTRVRFASRVLWIPPWMSLILSKTRRRLAETMRQEQHSAFLDPGDQGHTLFHQVIGSVAFVSDTKQAQFQARFYA